MTRKSRSPGIQPGIAAILSINSFYGILDTVSDDGVFTVSGLYYALEAIFK